jgi:photosystem II stability/assembly factor-like uncharacterized protein
MKKLFNILLLVSILSSCEKYPNSGFEILESINFTLIGNNQFAESGQYATDSVGIQIDMQYLTYSRPGGIIATIEGIEGGGSVDQTLFNLKDDGKILTRWKLGSKSNAQKLKITLSDSEGNYLTSAQLNAVSYFLGDWNKIESGYLTGISDMVSDTANHRSMLISGGRPYQSGEKFYQWKLVGENSTSSFTTLEINSNNELFAGTWDGDLYKSSDWGKTWVLFPKPIQNYSGYFQLTITPDDYIWVSRWDYGIRCSKDGGITWQKNKAGLNVEEEMGRVHLLNNGSHIALSQNQLKILQTFDHGTTWSPLNTPKYSLACYVTEKDEIIALNQDNGYSLFKSVDYGQTYQLIKAISTEYGSWPLDHTFAKFGGYYYVLPPGGGLWKTSNFESTDFEKIGNFTEQQHVYTDFRGTVYAVGLSGKTAYILDAAKN